MFKARGSLKILGDKKIREITYDKGKITGDDMFVFELRFMLDRMEKYGDAVGPSQYFPKGKYEADATAVMLTIRMICDNLQLQGDIPTLKAEEGVDY
ncbi:hypothetical protein NX029_26115 [Cytobacillus firmus]|nr:hypothetical protein [Cytobacillus firmus]